MIPLVKKQVDETFLDNVFTLSGALTPEECKWLLDRGEELGYEQSTVYSAEEDNNIVRKDIRDNHRVLEKFPQLSEALWKVVGKYFPEEIGKIRETPPLTLRWKAPIWAL